MEEIITLKVEQQAEAPRLDAFLSASLADRSLSRSRLQKLIDDGKVLVDGKLAKPSLKLYGGEHIELSLPEAEPLSLKAEAIPLQIAYEDEQLIVINKECGQVVHPGAGVSEGTLVNALLAHCQNSLAGINGSLRPGIVHRLDKDTSGLLVVAKTDQAHQSLSEQISKREAKRVYLALLEGQLPADTGIVDKPIGRHKTDRIKMAIVEDGRQAQTHWEVVNRNHRFTLIKASLRTGRTHQIRVHMASLNCPVVGDLVYNRKSTGNEAARKKLGLRGHALHAAYLSFRHPTSGELLEFESEPPAEFQKLIASL
ncbi:MAG: RluA family pseudouridine synthase [Candidatus Obscuribacterales bacterium]|nr:RluA family pseudouridine synthase [Candidatus Obscuribacterales bacterium]